ncbi:MAG: DUF6969 family protein [Alphaproteobacteria bacterium]
MNKTAVKKSKAPPAEDFSRLSRKRLEEMAEAAEIVVDCHRVLAKTGDNIVGELLRGVDTFYEMDHYPDSDIFDPETHSQFYYHSHPSGERQGEHGHFHTFLRPDGMPKGIKPAPLADFEPPEDPDDALSHLIAISMDDHGVPVKIFTVNRWVTGDVWYTAKDVIRMLKVFEVDIAHPSWPVNRWVSGMVHLFRPQIERLLIARDKVLAAWEKAHPDTNAYEDRDIELISEYHISIDDQVRAVTRALGAK